MEQVHASTTRHTADGLRTFAEQEASVLFTGELARRQEAWRGALASVKHTLADLEATGEAVIGASRDAVSALIEKIVTAAAADAATLEQRIEADAKAIAEAQALADRLQAEVTAGQEHLQLARQTLDVEQAARARAESAAKEAQDGRARAESAAKDAQAATTRAETAAEDAQAGRARAEAAAKEAQTAGARAETAAKDEQAARARAEAAAKKAQAAHDQARSALETRLRSQDAELQSLRGEVAALHEQLAAAQAERATLAATFEALQNAVHGAVSTLSHVPPAAATPRRAATPAHGARGDATRVPDAGAPVGSAASSSSSAHAERRAAIREVLPAGAPPSGAVYVTALLESVEAMYAQDVESAVPPAEVVRRLTDNLRYASRLLTERLGSDPAAEHQVLKDEIAKLLHTRSATPFGRDLAIAAGEAERHERRERSARAKPPGEATATPDTGGTKEEKAS